MCICSLSGWWRYQVNMLIMRSIDLMCQTGSIDEILEYDARIPWEFHLSKWLPHTQHTFAEWKDKKCPVVSQLLMDGIIAERSNETGDTNTEMRIRRSTEPITGITMTLTGHGSEIFGGSLANIFNFHLLFSLDLLSTISAPLPDSSVRALNLLFLLRGGPLASEGRAFSLVTFTLTLWADIAEIGM